MDEEIDFPVPAMLLDNPVVTLEVGARCKGKHVKGLVSFADLEFRPGTVAAWLHAASAVTPPTTWDGLPRWLS